MDISHKWIKIFQSYKVIILHHIQQNIRETYDFFLLRKHCADELWMLQRGVFNKLRMLGASEP